MQANIVTPTKTNPPSDADEGGVYFFQRANEGGVYFFERIANTPSNTCISSANPGLISASDSDNDTDAPTLVPDTTSIEEKQAVDDEKKDFDSGSFSLDMIIDTDDDLFADLEAAADSNDDSEISLDDLMDMDLEAANRQDRHDLDDASQAHSLADDNELSASLIDDDFMMTNGDDDNAYNLLTPVTSKESQSAANIVLESLARSSPTSVAQHMPTPPLTMRLPSASMMSASTRPALQQMRKMMETEMGEMSPTTARNSQLPCAQGMDEMYMDTLRKLSASMERSKKTRQSLSIPMHNTPQYSRSMCVSQIVQSVQTSSHHVDTCLRSVSMMNQ